MTRKRTARRAAERSRKKLDEARLALALLGEGFASDKPIRVESASQIEPHVRNMTCPIDGNVTLHPIEHGADRVVTAECRQCGRRFRIHFAIVKPS